MEAYPNRATLIGDLYCLKTGIAVDVMDVMVKTGVTVNGRAEVTKMTSAYPNKDAIGISANKIAADYPYREITVLVKGPAMVKLAKAVTINQLLQAASNALIELFSGDGTAQQIIYLGNVPVGAITDFRLLPSTTKARVYTTPTSGQYSLDDTTGKLIIGGTSSSGTNNYQATYSIDSARLEPLVDIVEETLTAASHIITLSQEPDMIEYIEAVTGTVVGAAKLQTANAPALAHECQLTSRANKTILFLAADAVLTAKVRYRTANKPVARALESKSAGEMCRVMQEGILR